MAHLTGKKGQVESGATVIAGCDTWSLDTEGDVVEVTDFDSDGVKEYIPANIGWSGSFECNFDTAQDPSASPPDLVEGVIVSLKLYLDDSAPPAEMSLSGDAIITGVSFSVPQADKIRYTVTFQGTGALTRDLTPV